MTTKTFDSTVSQLLQDNSSVEYIDSHENPIATIPNETQNCVSSNPLFDLHAEHNGEHCIASLERHKRKQVLVYRCNACRDLQRKR